MQNLFRLAVIVGVILASSLPAVAKGKHKYKHPDAYRYVHAQSQYNAHKGITAPVRHARLGDQVLIPQRGWTYCAYSCVYTLQKEYLDFWEGQQDGLSTGLLNDLLDRLRD